MSFLAIFLLLVGIILLAIGVVLVVIYRPPNERQWWMWGLLVLGAILFLIGLGIWIFGWYQNSLLVEDMPLTTVTTSNITGAPLATTTTRRVEMM